ncbi:hypothetical protein, partial [Vibrio parahaemolyticus]|uniref:hypothetical protein n=1 Tax=Vibrio parahaemolyticus TaxID=670 RepID=UPI001C5E53B9
ITRRSSVQIRLPQPILLRECETLAQLVERNLAKVEVTSSNLVCRSTFSDEKAKFSSYLTVT